MSLLKNIAGQVAKNALGSANNQSQNGALGNILGSVLGGGMGTQNQNGADIGALLQSALSGDKKNIAVQLLPVVLGFIQKHGGVSALLSQVQGALGGQSLSQFDANDVEKVFSKSEIDTAATQAGCSQSEAKQSIAQILPQVLGALSNNGAAKDGADAQIGNILQQVSKFIK